MRRPIVVLMISMLSLITTLPTALIAQEATTEPAQEATGDSVPVGEFYHLQRYEGDGYSLLVPPNATVNQVADDTIQIAGPDINIRPTDADFEVSGAAYQLTIATYDNPDELSSEAWSTQDILTTWQAAQDNNEFAPPLPVTEAGELDPETVEAVTLAGLPAFRINFFGGDSTLVNLYVANGNRVLVISYSETIVANDPMALVGQDVYALLLATLELDEPA